MRPLHRIALAAAIAVLAGSLAGCAKNPVTGHTELSLISESQEIAIGRVEARISGDRDVGRRTMDIEDGEGQLRLDGGDQLACAGPHVVVRDDHAHAPAWPDVEASQRA